MYRNQPTKIGLAVDEGKTKYLFINLSMTSLSPIISMVVQSHIVTMLMGCNLTPLDFFLGRYLKAKVHAIEHQLCLRVVENMNQRIKVCQLKR